jgi:hypothetical protein
MVVILSPSLVILSETKDLGSTLRINSAKNLIISTESTIEILRLLPQNDITTQSLKGEGSSSFPLEGEGAKKVVPEREREQT